MRFIFLLIIACMLRFDSLAQSFKVMTYNIRYDAPKDGENNWEHRKKAITNLFNYYQPDILGIQEGLPHQVSYLDSALSDYNYFGIGRDGNQKGEYSALFYNKERFKVIEQSTFWLSETSNKVSKGWDAALPRICTYGLFKDLETSQRIWIFNTHFDHVGVEAREHSAALIIQKVGEVNKDGLPVIVMGDLNSEPDTKPVKILSEALSESSSISKQLSYGPKGTFNGFDIDLPVTRKIDYIFVKGVDVLSHIQIDDRKNNNYYISDHLPVMATLEISEQ